MKRDISYTIIIIALALMITFLILAAVGIWALIERCNKLLYGVYNIIQ